MQKVSARPTAFFQSEASCAVFNVQYFASEAQQFETTGQVNHKKALVFRTGPHNQYSFIVIKNSSFPRSGTRKILKHDNKSQSVKNYINELS